LWFWSLFMLAKSRSRIPEWDLAPPGMQLYKELALWYAPGLPCAIDDGLGDRRITIKRALVARADTLNEAAEEEAWRIATRAERLKSGTWSIETGAYNARRYGGPSGARVT